MQMVERVILVSIGTDGDVYPFLHIGMELRKRGFRVTLATHDHFAEPAAAGDLAFLPLVSNSETKALLENPSFWHPLKGPFIVGRWGLRMFRRHYETLKAAIADKDAPDTCIVAGTGMLAARVLQEQTQVRLISVVLQPWVMLSVHSPPAVMGGLTLPRWAPRPLMRANLRILEAIVARTLGSEVAKLRASLGLGPMRNMFRWWYSPDLILALFPEWFGKPAVDWPKQIRLTGFPLGPLQQQALPERLKAFSKSGVPVIAFTFGTGMMHARSLFDQAIEACRLLGVRGIFLSRFRSQLPQQLPPFVHHCEFAAFGELFPLCAAVVHHGGIGTVASAMAAGIPQLIVPFAFDQMDNAVRVQGLGAGVWIKPGQRNHQALAASLSRLLKRDVATAAGILAERLSGRNGVQRAADHVEEFIRGF